MGSEARLRVLLAVASWLLAYLKARRETSVDESLQPTFSVKPKHHTEGVGLSAARGGGWSKV
jgi:hypothetical protein